MAPDGTPSNVPDFKFAFDKAKAIAELKEAGYGPDKPVSFTLLSTNGVFPNDYEHGARPSRRCGRRVGINATIEGNHRRKIDRRGAEQQARRAPLFIVGPTASGDPENYAGRIFDPRPAVLGLERTCRSRRGIDKLMTEVK